MFGFGKKKQQAQDDSGDLKQKLVKTRKSFFTGFKDFLTGKTSLDAEVLDELQMRLISADVGIETSEQIIRGLEKSFNGELTEQSLSRGLAEEMLKILEPFAQEFTTNTAKPFVILMVGVNGVGKTTTIGKLARKLKDNGKSVMLAAGDTFRAAAVEQLKTWGDRNEIPVVAQETGSDSASVIFDAVASAKAKGVDVVICDTAGRLHTQSNLMEELKKIKRVMQKHDESYPHETMLVLDASVGQNALVQAREFSQAIGLDSIILSKMDGTAKGGILLALARELEVPVKFVGVGESLADLREFNPKEFVKAISSPNIS